MSMKSRARNAGRKIAGGLASSGMAMAGGGVYFGAQTLLYPTVIGGDTNNIIKRSWILPVAGIVAGHMLTALPKVGAVGLGAVGGATAMGIEQLQLAMTLKKNQGVTATNTGALLEPSEVRQIPAGSSGGGYSDAGAMWSPPVHEAAGLSL